ncbi:uncharacterized protein M421DRAFT_2784 [Didymella exigua CBS 183.55]|uniref:Uncharacterized protein n=1 Tax=Didymella exigua CBS 183.55 TaxID=1150837 RepID=A0A6A5RVT9_9PLEO|nr:uncharacterized protein M421DRAFT_2784 [Didymella exigua CBS 183.55]KAF1931274.1 hypothetical protein M421DRAFT_2784 [Didymella exigua CBS 183.55]
MDHIAQLADDVFRGKGIVSSDGVEFDLSVLSTDLQTQELEESETGHDLSEREGQAIAPQKAGDKEKRRSKNARRRNKRKEAGTHILTDVSTNPPSEQTKISIEVIVPTDAEPIESSAGWSTPGDTGATASEQDRPLIVGLYGVSGAGKSRVLEQLASTLATHFDFVDGSALVDKNFGLAAFKKLDIEEQL